MTISEGFKSDNIKQRFEAFGYNPWKQLSRVAVK